MRKAVLWIGAATFAAFGVALVVVAGVDREPQEELASEVTTVPPRPAPAPVVVAPADAGVPTGGILGDPALQQGGAFASLTGTGDLDDADIQGGLLGNEVGEMQGGFGYGMGSGSGSGWGTIGTGRYGTIGHGSGSDSGYGIRSGGGPRGHSANVPHVKIGKPTLQGDLDPAIVRRYVKRNIAKITYCYEKRLLSIPTLEGTVTSRFAIGADGLVASAEATGVDDEVASCIAHVIYAIEFPKPKSGNLTVVTYPLTLEPTGG
jgi:hypothetical protein